ncbi:nuclear protein MDM1 isoform X2 [Esox lucius]|uniref:nuclear protein MDM1 isoform X2 n=1 Tax=Esox lucius TaxID=8010 RepID=UPI0014769832|nr:nuclear protein MDM1 isoform X2 [Esox lucius]
MPVDFKGISEYQNKYKGRVVRSRSASPQRRMRLAGLRSDQLGISREPQFLSKRKVPSTHAPQVSSSFQWNPTTTETQQRRDENPRSGPPTQERAQTPLAPGGRPNGPTGDHQQGPTTLYPDSAVPQVQKQTRSPIAAVERQESAFNGVQHVLRRKAGLKPSGKRPGLHKSEYGNQFQWKTPVAGHASPLLAAEQMLYTSNRAIPPFKSNPGVMETEYSRNFKATPPSRGPRRRRNVEEDPVPLSRREKVSPEKTVKGRRKNKREQKERTYGDMQDNIPVPQSHERPRENGMLQQEVKLQSSQKVPHPHRKMKTEYRSNFRPPLNYTYKDGAWMRATSGGQEVRELREKADAYKRRAWGTHFSRLHLNQILSDQNQLWEASTPSSSNLTPGTVSGDGEDDSGSSPTVQGLDLASVEGSSSSISGHPASITPGSSRRSSVKGAGDTAGPSRHLDTGAPPVQRKLAWEENAGMSQRKDRKRTEDREEEEKEKEAEDKVEGKERQNEQMLQEQGSASSSDGFHSPVEGGRMPTPTLYRIATVQRTHHDLTTPATGTRTHHDLTTPATGTRTHHDLTTPATGTRTHHDLTTPATGTRTHHDLTTPTTGTRTHHDLTTPATGTRTHHDLTTTATGTRTHHDLTTTATGTRTHHDLTTPATGGAILVSPPKIKGGDRNVRSEAPLGKPSPPFKHLSLSSQKGAPTQVEKQSQLQSPPAAGLSTKDPLPLREDSRLGVTSQENPPDPPPRTKMSHKPATTGQPQIAAPPPVNRIQGTLRDPEFQHNGNLGLRTSELLLCPNGGCGSDDEDDRMSQISSRSTASCSRASEVLGRAQMRKDFWGKM